MRGTSVQKRNFSGSTTGYAVLNSKRQDWPDTTDYCPRYDCSPSLQLIIMSCSSYFILYFPCVWCEF